MFNNRTAKRYKPKCLIVKYGVGVDRMCVCVRETQFELPCGTERSVCVCVCVCLYMVWISHTPMLNRKLSVCVCLLCVCVCVCLIHVCCRCVCVCVTYVSMAVQMLDAVMPPLRSVMARFLARLGSMRVTLLGARWAALLFRGPSSAGADWALVLNCSSNESMFNS